MAKVTDVNINVIGNDVGYGFSGLMTLLLANGWTFVSCGTGTSGTRRPAPTPGGALSLAEWIAANNTWQIVSRPLLGAGAGTTVYVVLRRVNSVTYDARFAHSAVAPTISGVTPSTNPDTFPAGTEVAYNSQNGLSHNRAHAITFDTDENTGGIRPFYLLMTDGTSALKGSVLLEAMTDGSFITANPAPYVVGVGPNNAANTNPLAGSARWNWWYSPSNVWVPSTAAESGLFGPTTGVGVDPWSAPAAAKDPNFPLNFGRLTSAASPGFVGSAKYIKGAGVLRGYPNTVDTTTDAYVYAGSCLLPYANNVVPL